MFHLKDKKWTAIMFSIFLNILMMHFPCFQSSLHVLSRQILLLLFQDNDIQLTNL